MYFLEHTVLRNLQLFQNHLDIVLSKRNFKCRPSLALGRMDLFTLALPTRLGTCLNVTKFHFSILKRKILKDFLTVYWISNTEVLA